MATAAPQDLKFIDMTLDTPDGIENQPKSVRFVIDKQFPTIVRRTTDGLIVARKLPINIEDVTIGDPIALLINQTSNWLTPVEAVNEAKAYYKKHLDQVAQDAYLLAITRDTLFNKEPKPYTDEEKEAQEEAEGLPNWLNKIVELPSPTRNLNNPLERRLKQTLDFVAECGVIYQLQFNNHLTNSIGTSLRLLGGVDKDADNFRPTDAGGQVSVPDSAESGTGGHKSRNGRKNEKTSASDGKILSIGQPAETGHSTE